MPIWGWCGMTCYICGKDHHAGTVCVLPARGCSPPLNNLSPEDAIRRGRGDDEICQKCGNETYPTCGVCNVCPSCNALSAKNKRLIEILNMTVSCISAMVMKASDANDYARNIQKGLMEEMEKVVEK